MRRLLLVTASAGLIASIIVAWLSFAKSDVAPTPAVVVGEPAIVDTAIVAAPTSSTAAPPEPERRPAATATHAATTEVRVVMADTREPVPDASVRFLPPQFDWSKEARTRAGATMPELDALFMSACSEVRTDATGCCRVPVSDHDAAPPVLAAKGDLFGRGSVFKNAGARNEVRLRRDHPLLVVVVDDAGAPVSDTPVFLRQGRAGQRPFEQRIGWTDRAGRLSYPHVQEFAQRAAEATFEVVVQFAGGEATPVAVDVIAPPPEVVVRLPRCGEVAVHVRDAAGQPIDPAYGSFREVVLSSWRQKPNAADERADWATFARIDRNGEARFGGVALGLHVVARLGFGGLRSGIVAGPTLGEPRVDVLVQEPVDAVVLTGVLQGPGEAPLANTMYSVGCVVGRVRTGASGTTDGAGRFRTTIEGLLEGEPATLSFQRATVLNSGGDVAVELEPRRLRRGSNDLGVVGLVPTTVLLAAKLVMTDGAEPLPLHMYVQRQDGDRWVPEHSAKKTWDRSGAFTFVGSAKPGTPMRLVVEAAGFLPIDPIEFTVGATGLEVPVRRGGSVVATFVVGPEVRIDRLELRCRNLDPTVKLGEFVRTLEARAIDEFGRRPSADGRVRREWNGLAPGTYVVQAMCGGSPVPIAEVTGLTVADGPCLDPRLEQIDLRGLAKTFAVRVTDGDGAPITVPDAAVIVRGDREAWRGFRFAGGVVELAAGSPVDLVVLADGFENAVVDGVLDSRTLVMQQARKQALRVEMPTELPQGATLHVVITPRGALAEAAVTLASPISVVDGSSVTSIAGLTAMDLPFDGPGRAERAIRIPGEYSIHAHVRVGSRTIRVRTEPAIAVLPLPDELVVRVPDAEWERAASGR